MKRNTLLKIWHNTQKQNFNNKKQLANKGKKILQNFSARGRIMPYYLGIDWEGLDGSDISLNKLIEIGKHPSLNIGEAENFSFNSLKNSLQEGVKKGIDNTNWKNVSIGAGIGGIAGLTYGYWDWQDAKKQAEFKGLEKPDKKKILIRDTLIGLGLGATAGGFADKLLKILENKKTTEAQKRMFDSIEKEILKGQDKGKIKKYLQLHKNDLTDEQYKFLSEFANSMTDRDKSQDIRDAKRNKFAFKLEDYKNSLRQKKQQKDNKQKNSPFVPEHENGQQYIERMQRLAKLEENQRRMDVGLPPKHPKI